MTPPGAKETAPRSDVKGPPGKPRATEGPASRPGSDFAAMLRGAWMREVWESTIGKKILVATTGAILAAYVVLHSLGNLEALRGTGGGDPFIDRYAEFLRAVGGPVIPRAGLLWLIRVVLILALVIHVAGITQLYRRNRAARPPGQRKASRLGGSWAARLMVASGILLLAFIVFHILQFTTGTIDVTPIREGAVYANVYFAFQKWYFVLIYVVAVLCLGVHLFHGLWSSSQTMGWDKPNRNATFRRVATGVTLFVVVAFISVPILFWTGALDAPPAG